MSSIHTSPERMGARKGTEAARAGKACSPDINWPKSIRDAYRVAYDRTKKAMETKSAS